MSTFYLVRHGLRVTTDEDTMLSEEGINQANLTGLYLKSKEISRMFVSPAKRTLHTSQVINHHLQVPQSTDSRLEERVEYKPKFGSFETFLEEWNKTMSDRNYKSPYGDSAFNAGNRIITLLEELDDTKNYVFISHGGVIGDAVRNMFPDEKLTLTTDSEKKFQWLNISECSTTEIQKKDGLFLLKKVGDTSHLRQ